VRHYDSQTAERGASQEIPFENILLPLPHERKAIRSNVAATVASSTRKEGQPVEIGRDAIGAEGAEDAEDFREHSSGRGTDERMSSMRESRRDSDKEPYKTAPEIAGFGDHPTEGSFTDEAPVVTTSIESRNLDAPLFLYIGEESEGPLMGKENVRYLPISPVRSTGSEKIQDETDLPDYVEDDIESTVHSPEISVYTDSQEKSVSRPIHLLGSGAVGKFIAHSLAGAPNAPYVTLLVHRRLLIQQWHDEGSAIKLQRDNQIYTKTGFNVELAESFREENRGREFPKNFKNISRDSIIENLIVTTQGHTTVSALAGIKHRLRSSSTICFMQDSLGVMDYVNSSVFTDPVTRPNYILGSISHDLESTRNKFGIVEKRSGAITLTVIPWVAQRSQTEKKGVSVRKVDRRWPSNSKFLIRTLGQVPELGATCSNTQMFFKVQLERLAIDSVIGPMSVVYGCFNDQLLSNYQASQTMKLLLQEISLILRSMPEISRIPLIDEAFSAKRLKRLVLSVIDRTGRNRSAMLQAVMDGKDTKIDFCNGYFLRRAKELGIDCPRLELIVSMVKGKQNMKIREKTSYIPFKD
jgi:2-dehydropantoate 2-reductase